MQSDTFLSTKKWVTLFIYTHTHTPNLHSTSILTGHFLHIDSINQALEHATMIDHIIIICIFQYWTFEALALFKRHEAVCNFYKFNLWSYLVSIYRSTLPHSQCHVNLYLTHSITTATSYMDTWLFTWEDSNILTIL